MWGPSAAARTRAARAARPYPRRDARVPALPLADLHDHVQTLEGLSRVRRRVSARAWFESGVAWPLDGEVTSEFGASRAHGVHLGIDLRAPIATEVRAPADGIVVMLVETAIFGRTVVIDHGHGLTSSLLLLRGCVLG